MPLYEAGPRSSLIHAGEVAADLAAAGETDMWSLPLDAGQTVSVRLEPQSGLDVALRVNDSAGAIDVTRDNAGPGGIEWISALPVTTASDWTLTVIGTSVGSYRLRVVVNAAWEEELSGTANNGAAATAQDLDSAFAPLAGGTGTHAAVIGQLSANLQIIAADDFESAALGVAWTTYASAADGRVRVTNATAAGGEYALVLDRAILGTSTLTEAIWTVDLAGVSSATLRFAHADFQDEIDPLPATFSGHANGDGVAISGDGQTWRTVLSSPNQIDGQWVPQAIDLSAAAAQAGISLSAGFRIKFQQFDNNSFPTDGRGFDEISISATTVADEDWYRFSLTDGETATIVVQGASVELYDAAAGLLATGTTIGGKSIIGGFRDLTADGSAGDYFVRVFGGPSDYHLVVLRDATFDAESGPEPVLSSGDADGRRLVLGAVDAAGGGLATVQHVVHISVDGLRADYLRTFVATRPADFPNFLRLQNESAHTYNAHTDYTHTNTLPNHTSMVTGRPVFQPAGQPNTVYHGWVVNDAGSIDPTDTLHNQGNPNVAYIASVFDVAHDHGLSTALFASKEKFIIYDQSYNAATGAADLVGDDNGRDKIDVYLWDETNNKAAVLVGGDGLAIPGFAAELAAQNFNYSFVHLRDPDTAGHGFGWGTTQWNDSVRAVDGYLGQIFAVLDSDPQLAGTTALVLTTDHGGGVPLTSHGTASAWENYTIPLFVWGAGLPPGGDLYDLFPGQRLDPVTARPDYNAVPPPFRNGETGNLALTLLGLPAIPGSTITSVAFDTRDTYSIPVNAGDELTIETATPADGPGEFFNTFDPVVQLLDPTGAQVASDDNSASDGRNARLVFTASMPGMYTVRLVAAPGSTGGIYVLSIAGATGSTTVVGDFDHDGKVGLADLAVLQQSYGSPAPNVDLTGDGTVDRTDAAIWARNLGRTAIDPGPPTPSAAARAGERPLALRANRRRPAHSPREDLLDAVAVDRLLARVTRRGRHEH